jgi:hypothetical protein
MIPEGIAAMSRPVIHIPGMPRVGSELKNRDVLWRYLDAAKFLDFVHNQTLFFSRGDQFEDKFEGAFTDSLKHSIQRSYDVNKIDFTYEEFRSRLRERVFVNCWHKSADDSMAMWSIYGRSSCSVALTTTVDRLRQSLEDENLPYDIAIEIAPYSRVFAYKTKAYEFEKEVRVLIDRFEGEFEADISETGMPIKVSSKSLLHSIVIAPEAPVWFENLVREVSGRYGVTVPVRRSLLAKEPI